MKEISTNLYISIIFITTLFAFYFCIRMIAFSMKILDALTKKKPKKRKKFKSRR